MARRIKGSGMGHGRGAWPVLLLLLATVCVPTLCVLWFMNQAMRNERFAVREKLIEVYRDQLERIPPRLESYWADVATSLDSIAPTLSADERFAAIIDLGICDSVLIIHPDGHVLYPSVLRVERTAVENAEWSMAEHVEFSEADPATSAELYAEIAASSENVTQAAHALQAQARCLAKAGKPDEAIRVLTGLFGDRRYAAVRDSQGRLIAVDGFYRAITLMQDTDPANTGPAMDRLTDRLNDYGEPGLPSNQRRFLMQQIQPFVEAGAFPTLEAERLATEYVDSLLRSGDEPKVDRARLSLYATPLTGIWSIVSSDRTILALYTEQNLAAVAAGMVDNQFASTDARVTLVSPVDDISELAPLLTIPAGESLPGWRLALHLQGNNPFTQAADRQVALYLWSGILMIVVTMSLSLIVTRIVTRQITLTRLKNDLIATVSHELKTPLASMRALVDTLLEERCRDDRQKREYLELIGKENTRLSHLIDNFLSFSRMERNRRAFDFADVSPEAVARAAIDSVRERFEANGCHFEIQIADGLPGIIGDHDALVTVLLNLLDNAHKYSDDEKHIRLRVFAEGAGVCFEVCDEGVGMSRRVMKRIFDRFYQADQNLSRRAGGCGLGLSITKFIVDAHGGRINVVSRPGHGSTFTVILPVNVKKEG